MDVFISYARRDAKDAARVINDDLEAGGLAPWYDRRLQGGDDWWAEILDRIEACGAFVFVLSPESSISKACAAEFGFAKACGRTIVPVMVRDVGPELFDDAIVKTHYLDYRDDKADLKLVAKLQSISPSPVPADPPVRPETPMTNLGPLRDRCKAATLTEEEQREILAEFRAHVAADENDQTHTLLALTAMFRAHKGIVESIADDLEHLMSSLPRSDDERPRLSWRSPIVKDKDTKAFLEAIAGHIRRREFTPILGMGMTEPLLGSRRQWTRDWARTIDFPLAEEKRDDLPTVAQWLAVVSKRRGLLSSLDEFLCRRLRTRYPDLDVGLDLDGLLEGAWKSELVRQAVPVDPHEMLAKLDCPVYIVAQPWNLMEQALRAQGKHPVVKVCPWRADAQRHWDPALVEFERGFTGTEDQPLVYHIFGSLAESDSLVITEDDYIEFVAGMSISNPEVPGSVQRRLTDSALMLLGFGLEDLDVRVLLRTFIGEASRRMEDYPHIAAQVDVDAAVIDADRTREYLKNYFYRVNEMKIYWGTVDDFTSDLAKLGSEGE